MQDFNISCGYLTFGPNVTTQVILVEIIDDELFEEELENFTVALSTSVLRLQLDPYLVSVTIEDTDSKWTQLAIMYNLQSTSLHWNFKLYLLAL